MFNRPLFACVFIGFAVRLHPRIRSVSVGSRGCFFHLSMVAALPENLPHRSREHEFTDGRVNGFRPVKDTDVLYHAWTNVGRNMGSSQGLETSDDATTDEQSRSSPRSHQTGCVTAAFADQFRVCRRHRHQKSYGKPTACNVKRVLPSSFWQHGRFPHKSLMDNN